MVAPTEAGQVLRDLIYFDFEKAASLLSQIEQGLPRETERSLEFGTTSTSAVSADLRVLASKLESGESERDLELVRRVLHHDLLVRVEDHLFSTGAAVDLNDAGSNLDFPDPRELIAEAAYVRVEGRVALEDYERLKVIARRFNELLAAIARSAASSAVDAQLLTQLEQQLQRAYVEVQAASEKKKTEAEALRRAVDLDQQIQTLFVTAAGLEELPAWLVAAIELWIETFMPGRLSVRVVPFDEHPTFHIVGNLRRASSLKKI